MFNILMIVVVLIVAGFALKALLYKDPITRQKLSVEEAQAPGTKSELIRKFQAAAARNHPEMADARDALQSFACGWIRCAR